MTRLRGSAGRRARHGMVVGSGACSPQSVDLDSANAYRVDLVPRWMESKGGGILDPNEPGFKGFKDYASRFLKTYDALVGFVAPHVTYGGLEQSMDSTSTEDTWGPDICTSGQGRGISSNPPRDIELTLVDASP